jgi:hypothetical protein
MPVTSVFTLTFGSTTYDLRKVSSYVASGTDALVRFIDMPTTTVVLPLATFEAAYQDALDAEAP